MRDRPEWFAPKRYGYGAGLPLRWQGWALLAVYTGLIVAAGAALNDQPLVLLAVVVPITLAMLLVAARTTRGGWRWRWGERD